MTSEHLEKRSVIDFPASLPQGGVQNLFHYLVKKIPDCYVRYDIEKKGTISMNEEGAPKDNETSLMFYGSIGMLSPSRTIPFKCYPEQPSEENGGLHLFSCLRFDVAPYTQLSQVQEEDLIIMDKVRAKSEEFFKSRKE